MKKELLKLPLKEKEKLIITELDRKFNLEDSKRLYYMVKEKPEIFGLTNNKWLKNWLEQATPALFSSQDFYSLVIFPLAHPAFLVEDIAYSKLKTFYWKYRLGPKRIMIEGIEKSVGRLVAVGSKGKDRFLGTCFRIAEDFVVTTTSILAPVASNFHFIDKMKVDFSKNRKKRPEQSFLVKKLVYTSQKPEPDLAIFQLEKKNLLQHSLPKQLSFSSQAPLGKLGLVIGYPFKITTESRKLERLAIFGSPWNLNRKRIAPGHLNGHTENSYEFSHDCTTETGNAGSPVIDLASCQILGMHCYKTAQGQGVAITAKYISEILKKVALKKP